MSILTKIFGDSNERAVKSLRPIAEKINELEKNFERMSAEELRGRTDELKKKAAIGEDNKELDEILPEAFAVVREAAKRVLGQRHYDEQLIGGIVLHRGQIAEMRTGEGKTLVATLPLYLNALAGRGAHLVTVNDYLARVGAGWMGPVYHFLGLSVGVIIHDQALVYDPGHIDASQYDERIKHFRPVARKEAYACDITYGTNNEFGFDYLRDNMAPSLDRMAQRDLCFAIVDEVDSILIDEARTPLIISAPAEESTDKYYKFAQLVARLKENDDYNIDEKMRAATLTEAGVARMEKWLGVDNIYTVGGVREVHHIEQALKAMTLFKRDRDYVVKDGEVVIVDEFTGRLMFGRRYSDGLHQAIEAKEGVKIQRESQTLATVTFQNYFRMYKKLSGMTGTALTEAEEFHKIYNLETVVIPTHKPMVRDDMNDLIYRTEEGKFKAVVEEAGRRHAKGQPILIGTISIEKNEILAEMMERHGLRPQILNAKNHIKEAQIIADAGRIGAVTIATNMAGRGVDIMLGGQEPAYAKASAGKPVHALPGEPATESEEHKKWREGHDKVVALGGLHVIGTERHEARRIDNQLRGRAGRQGDSGSSQFYVSTEDDLMRIFGGDRMKAAMTALKVPEDMPIENRIISRSIESAQRKVEGNNFDIRKHLVEYDDVLNKHREAIYRRRKEILEINFKSQIPNFKSISNFQFSISNLSKIILKMVENEIEQVVSFHTAGERTGEWNLKEIREVVSTIFLLPADMEEKLKGLSASDKFGKAQARTAIIDYLMTLAKENYEKIAGEMSAAGFDWSQVEKDILIRSIDMLWIEHLDAIANLRQGIGLRGYGQRDPLIEYKKEAYILYNELNNLIQKEVVYSIYKIGEAQKIAAFNLLERVRNFSAPAKEAILHNSPYTPLPTGQAGFGKGGNNAGTPLIKGGGEIKKVGLLAEVQRAPSAVKTLAGKKVGRNDPCLCGSGKKYKKCCGK